MVLAEFALSRCDKGASRISTWIRTLALAALVVPALCAGQSAWTAKAPMPTARHEPSAVTIGGLIYVAGGYSGGNLNVLEAYDPATNSWSTKAYRPDVGTSKAHGVIDNILYETGGTNCCVAVNSTFAYDPATDSWATKASMSTARQRPIAGVINGKLYVAGGLNPSGARNTLEVYDPTTNAWSTLAAMPTARYGSGGGVIDGLLYVVGGTVTGGADTSVLEIYNPATNSWTTGTSMPTARSNLATAVLDGMLYAIGGTVARETVFLSTVEAYDPATNTWSSKPSLLTTRGYPRAVAVGGTLYVMGGFNGAELASMEAYTPLVPDTQAPTLPTGLSANAASAGQIDLAWTASTDSVGVTAYKVYRNGTLVGQPSGASYQDTGLSARTSYSYTVAACDAAGNCSAQSAAASATTPALPDTEAPTVPTGLAAITASANQIDLTWTTATDDTGVASYKVYRNGLLIGTSSGRIYQDSGIRPSSGYTYAVAACDAAGNCSRQSESLTVSSTAAIMTNNPIYTIDNGEMLKFSASVTGGGAAGTPVDFYMQATFSAGAPAFYLGPGLQWTTSLFPLVRGFSFADAYVPDFYQMPVIGGYPPGYYQFAAIVAPAGSDPGKSSNRLAYGVTTVAIRSRSQIPSPALPTLSSLSATAATPYSTLTIYGSGLGSGNAPVSVRFIPPNGGVALTVPASSPSPTSLQVVVPPLYDPASGKFTSAAVQVQVVQIVGGAIVTSNPLAGLQIATPPEVPAGTPAGVMTAALLSAASEVLAGTRQSIASAPDLASVDMALSAGATSLDSLIAKVNAVSANSSASYAISTSKGSAVTLDAASLALTDQMLQAVASELAGRMSSGNFAAATPECPRFPNDPLVHDNNVCMIKRFFQNLSGANPAVRAEAEKALINLGVGAFGTAFGGGVPLASQLAWSAIWTLGYSYLAEGTLAPGTDVAQGVTSTVLDELSDTDGMIGFAADMYKIFEIAATSFPSQKGVDLSFGLPVTTPGGGTAVIFPAGVALVTRVPATQASIDSTSYVVVAGGFKPVQACAYVYSDWSACQSNGMQTRTVEKTPAGCVATTSPGARQQACTYVPVPCTSYNYSEWSVCSLSNTQTRTVISKSPAACTGTGVTTQACTYVPPVCTAYTYTDWSACTSNNTQTRMLLTKTPAGCAGTGVTSQACTYAPPQTNTYSGSFSADFPSFSDPVTGCQFTARMSGTISLILTVAGSGAVTGSASVPSSVSINPASSSSSGQTCTSGSSSPQISGQVSGTEQSISGTLSDNAGDRPYTITFSGQRIAGTIAASMSISRTFGTVYDGSQTGFFSRSVTVPNLVLR